MGYCKLQIGCLMVVLYIMMIYYKEQFHFHRRNRFSIYEGMMLTGVINLILDGTTAYMVNQPEYVNTALNMVLHGMFLISIDTIIFTMLLYMLSKTDGIPAEKWKRAVLFVPFLLTIMVVLLFLRQLEYRSGKLSRYSMGISVYTCFIMAALYVILTLILVFRRWDYMQSRSRYSILSCILILAGVTGYQMMFPDTLISSIGVTLIILSAYLNQEDPAVTELNRYNEEMVMGFATLIESRDENTGGHVKRTTRYVKLLSEELHRRGMYREILTKDYMKNLLLAAPMHDIGKIAVSDAILQKPGKLTDEEFEQMKMHAARGGEIIRKTFERIDDQQYLQIAYEIARHHHEKWNGRGYPDGLQSKEIPLCAQIMAIADVFDAVSADRCYRQALPLNQCFDIIEKGSGQDFNPILVEVFLDIRDKVEEITTQK